jgi:CBS-domain-containing membrane protein
MALAVSASLAVMMATRTVHPPAGSNPVIIFLTQADWIFLLFPTMAGVFVLLFVAFCFLKITDKLKHSDGATMPRKSSQSQTLS